MTLLVAVTGGSGSGKTTFATALVEALHPDRAQLVSEDWYYRDVGGAPGFDPATFDFDDLSVRDHALLLSHLQALKSGQSVSRPQYCFVRHARLADGPALEPGDVVVVEGSQLLCREELRSMFDVSIYLDVPDDIRFIRRLLRDQSSRGRSAQSVIGQYLATVRPAHQRWTAPSRSLADLVIADDGPGVVPTPEDLDRLVSRALDHPGFTRMRRPAQG